MTTLGFALAVRETPTAGYTSSAYEWPPDVVDIYALSGCISEHFTDYVNYWKHNGLDQCFPFQELSVDASVREFYDFYGT